MKILLDECVTKRLKEHLKEFEFFTVSEAGWSGIKNGMLMSLCVENNFDLLLTIDKNIINQQNISKHKLTVVVLDSATSKLEALLLYLPSFKAQLAKFEKNKAYVVER